MRMMVASGPPTGSIKGTTLSPKTKRWTDKAKRSQRAKEKRAWKREI